MSVYSGDRNQGASCLREAKDPHCRHPEEHAEGVRREDPGAALLLDPHASPYGLVQDDENHPDVIPSLAKGVNPGSKNSVGMVKTMFKLSVCPGITTGGSSSLRICPTKGWSALRTTNG